MLGKIIGRTSTMSFQFLVKGPAKKLDYVWIPSKDYDVLAQIVEIEKSNEESTAYCNIIGYRDGTLKHLRVPLEPGSEVLKAEDVFIKNTLGLGEIKNGAFIGHLNGYDNLKVFLDLNKLLTKHVAVLAKSGSGKCISPKTKILLSNGYYEEVEKIVDERLERFSYVENGVEVSNRNKDHLRIFGLDEKNRVVETKIRAFMRRKVKEKLILIKTRTGKEIELTEEHKIPVLDEFIFWKDAGVLDKGDYLIIPRPPLKGKNQSIDIVDILKGYPLVRVNDKRVNSLIRSKLKILGMNLKGLSKNFDISYTGFLNWFGKSGIPLNELIKMCELLGLDLKDIKKNMSYLHFYRTRVPNKINVNKKFSRLLSYLLAEGHNDNKNTITFTNSDKAIQEEFVYLFEDIFKITPSRTTNNEFRVYSSLLSKIFYNLGFTNSSKTKFIPEPILKSKKGCISAFLEGFIDCDGYVAKNSPSMELNLSSRYLIEGLENMLMRLGIIPVKSMKKINGKNYPKITVYGSKNFKTLNSLLNLKIEHKRKRLKQFSKLEPNPNIDIVPHVGNHIKVISNILNMHESESRVNNFLSYSRNERNPSLETLKILIEDIERKHECFKGYIKESVQLYNSLPKVNEKKALEYLENVHNLGISFEKIAYKTSISGTTVRRMVRGITALTNNTYILAGNSLNISGLEDKNISLVNKIDFVNALKKIRELCTSLGYGLALLCFDGNRGKNYIYENIMNNSNILYSTLLSFSERLKDIALQKEKELIEVEYRLQFLKSLMRSNMFFDEIVSIEKKNYEGYVYDLETDTHNFVANNILIHNSYTVACLIEEILEKEIPVLVIDPHGEYSSLKYKNDKDEIKLKKFKIEPKAYSNSIQEYSPDIENNPKTKPLKLNAYNLNSTELVHLLPARLSNAQLGLLYSGLRNMKEKVDFDSLINELELEENNAKYTLINLIEFIQKLNLFSNSPTSLQELIQPGKCTIINLKGIQTELQEVVVYKLMKDLFEARKKSDIPPFFAIIEEAHNYIPERSFGEAKSSAILRQISSEGRKFGLGLSIISQRPARIDKSVLSQTSTQIILKVTNPGDIKAIANSVEGLTGDTEKEIKNIPIGTAMITGVVDLPLFVDIRPRMTKHGGEAVNMIEAVVSKKDFLKEAKDFDKKGELLNVIQPRNSKKDIELMTEKKIKKIFTKLIPCLFVNFKDFNVLINLNNGELIKEIDTGKGDNFTPKMDLSPQQKKVFDAALTMNSFTSAEIFSKTGLQFSDVYDVVVSLVKKGYFVQEGNKYKLSKSFNLNLQEYACYVSPDFSRIDYDEKLEKIHNSEEILRFLENFSKAKSSKECFLVVYGVEYS